MAPQSHKKDRGISKFCFHHIGQSDSLDLELRYNELTDSRNNSMLGAVRRSVSFMN